MAATSHGTAANVEIAMIRANDHARTDDSVTGIVLSGTPTVCRIHPHASHPRSLGEAGGMAEVGVDLADEGVDVAVVVEEPTTAHSKATAIHAVSLGTGLHNVPTPLK